MWRIKLCRQKTLLLFDYTWMYLKRTDLCFYLFSRAKKIVFREYLFSWMASFWTFWVYKCLGINKVLSVKLKETHLRHESFIELHFQVFQAIKHIKRIIAYIIFATIVVWCVTIRFPFGVILAAVVFIIASGAVGLFQGGRGDGGCCIHGRDIWGGL